MKIIILLISVFVCGQLFSQNVNYQIIYDNPIMGISIQPSWSVDMQGRGSGPRPTMFIGVPIVIDYKLNFVFNFKYYAPLFIGSAVSSFDSPFTIKTLTQR